MSRTERRKSESNIYHVMLRGINRQQIFYDEEDNMYFIQLLNRFKEVSAFENSRRKETGDGSLSPFSFGGLAL